MDQKSIAQLYTKFIGMVLLQVYSNSESIQCSTTFKEERGNKQMKFRHNDVSTVQHNK